MHTTAHAPLVVGLDEIDRRHVALVGGKAAHLGELSRIGGVDVPPGFCVTTEAFRRVFARASLDDLLDRLAGTSPADAAAVRTISVAIRSRIEATPVADDITRAITSAITGALGGTDRGWAVRSSATTEDLPTVSFAGQHDTYLCIRGTAAVVDHVRRCWSSLYSERAVASRIRHGFDHRAAAIAVVVQQMVEPEAAGVMFTADPVTGNRTVVWIEATYGLGESLVAGRVDPDVHTVRAGVVVATTIGGKQLAMLPADSGGTREVQVPEVRRQRAALADAEVMALADLGRRIEVHFGHPQDIEWCLAGGQPWIVQSRPITTLFPVPSVDDGANHVFVSVGHQQMMTDAMKPLGLSMWQLIALRPMLDAGGRLFVDVTSILASPGTRAPFLGAIGAADPLIGDALSTVVERGDFLPPPPDETPATGPGLTAPGVAPAPIEADPSIVDGLVAMTQASIDGARRAIVDRSGADLIDFVVDDIGELKRVLADAMSMRAIMAGMEAAWWLDQRLNEWLGETNVTDVLTRSAPGNVTSEMGLELLDVADAIRPHPDVVAFLREVDPAAGDRFLDGLASVPGGRAAHDAITAYLGRYGMRCAGEIDITRPRWSERPGTLVPIILGNVDHFDPGERRRRFDQGVLEAETKERELLVRLRAQPDGEQRAAETEQMIARVRTFAGYREYPKYGIVCRLWVYKQALLAEGQRLVRDRVLQAADDIFFLTVHELRAVVTGRRADAGLVDRRRHEFRSFESLAPPRVMTSDGEIISGSYRRDDVPAGALIGIAVSAGTVEGRARVVLDMADANLEPGDILVTPHTDPSWSPLFVTISGLVTEVGGRMTHGAVIAREYGLPAVVGIERATRLIEDGQRIRVDGTNGRVQILAAG